MNVKELLQMLEDNKYYEVALNSLMEYVGENARRFEHDDLERRARILELQLRDWNKRHDLGEEVRDKIEEALRLIVTDEELAVEDIPSEDEDSEVGLPIYKISSYPSDPTLEGLYIKKKRDEFVIPRFQRGWVWSATQASRLIESFLLGLPVPSIFVYKEVTGKQLVIDGQQRLKTIWGYFDGELPDGSPFHLRGVDPQWNGLSYAELKEADKIRFRDSILRVVIVEQVDPKDMTSIYHIFERLNTGGTGLTTQEVRNCSYHGPFNDMLFKLNEYKTWRLIFGLPKPDARMRDLELITRFFALRETEYSKPMKGFLNRFMGRHQWESENDAYERLFKDTVDKVHGALGARPFHIKRGINAAVFDSVMVAFSKNVKIPGNIIERYEKLLSNNTYAETIKAHTTDTDTVKQRLELAEKVLFH
ncbi:MAG: DUF262 domain-containing protein [Chloroflexi bacterium]|nr:MAG: DUF262 domain-containing protein [Chloroflexota bacterium]